MFSKTMCSGRFFFSKIHFKYISKTIQSVIDTGKSAIWIVTGNFENVNQINEAVKNGGILDSVSEIFDSVLNKIYSSGKLNDTTSLDNSLASS